MKSMVDGFDESQQDAMCESMMTGGDVSLFEDMSDAGLDCFDSMSRNSDVSELITMVHSKILMV